KSQFEKRLSAMVKIAKRADEFFPKCDPQTKSSLAMMLKGAYEGLAQEIRESPIPDGVPQDAIPELKAGLAEMAKPFDDKASVYAQVILPGNMPENTPTVVDRIGLSLAHAETAEATQGKIDRSILILNRDPESLPALEALRDAYRAIGKERLSGYFEGRLRTAGGRK
ncbi:hypothetical protein EBZ37_09810, partial [bacterium]|nr:hypothetical protein [bacterium]